LARTFTWAAGGSANLLAISNGGFVVSSNACPRGELGASGNSALVVGAGSVWSNRNLLSIGSADRDNQLVVSTASALFVAAAAWWAGTWERLPISHVTARGPVWSNAGVINLGDGQFRQPAGDHDGGRLEGSEFVW